MLLSEITLTPRLNWQGKMPDIMTSNSCLLFQEHTFVETYFKHTLFRTGLPDILYHMRAYWAVFSTMFWQLLGLLIDVF